jgi:hypothetical protein
MKKDLSVEPPSICPAICKSKDKQEFECNFSPEARTVSASFSIFAN